MLLFFVVVGREHGRGGEGEVENSAFFGFSAMAGVLREERGSSERGQMPAAA